MPDPVPVLAMTTDQWGEPDSGFDKLEMSEDSIRLICFDGTDRVYDRVELLTALDEVEQRRAA